MSSNEMIRTQLVDVGALSRQLCPRPIQVNLVYATSKNLVGRPIDGYTPGVTDVALLTKIPAEALCKVQNELLETYNYGLLIYDSYRPKRAVKDFMGWSTQPVANDSAGLYELERKAKHYPHINKNQLFDLGYVSADSQHCYGHTVDLVLIDENGIELNLGARFDFMDKLSHITATADEIGEEALRNRKILSDAMQRHGFIPYEYEFWHFSHKDKTIHEPIDIVITAELRG